MKVSIAFDLNANGQGNFLTLSDTIRGKLNDSAYPLAGEVLVDVTDRVRNISIRRGRSRELDKFTSAQANVVLDNRDRVFDPLNVAGPYFGQLVPKKRFSIEHLGQTLVIGQVEDWMYDYDISGDSVVTASCADAFAQLAPVTVTPGTAVSQATGARVNAVLDQIQWPATLRDISDGFATLAADVVNDNTSVLTYLQAVELSERGLLFIGRDGQVVFKDRLDTQNPTTGITFGTGGIPFTAIDVASSTTEMTNTVEVTWVAGSAVAGTATSADAASIAAYGELKSTYATLLSDEAQAQALAGFIVSKYAQPTYRVNQVSVLLDGLTTEQGQQVVGVELGDVCMVTWTPNGVGDEVSQSVIVDAIEHQADPRQHVVTFTLSQALGAFVLDSSLFGQLGVNKLGFS